MTSHEQDDADWEGADKTFDALRKKSFEEVLALYREHSCKYPDDPLKPFFSKHGWTFHEFINYVDPPTLKTPFQILVALRVQKEENRG